MHLSVVSTLLVQCLKWQRGYNCLMQRELQESKRSVESMRRWKATAEQQKRDADTKCATLQVFYWASLSEPHTS